MQPINRSRPAVFLKVEIVNGARLVIKVKEFPTINRVAFEGNSRIKDEVLAGLVKAKRAGFLIRRVEQDRAVIAEAYASWAARGEGKSEIHSSFR